MPALSNSYRIENFSPTPTNGLNKFWIVDNVIVVVDSQSTVFKESGILSYANKLEIQKIGSFSDLERNWDSYNAEELNSNTISKAIDIVKEIDILDEDVYFTSPGPNGEIMIQLKKESKEVELIIYEDRTKYITFVNNEFVKQGSFSLNILSEIIEWLNL